MSNMCVSDKGYADAEAVRFGALSTAATVKQVVAVAQAALNAKAAIDNYKKLRDITSLGIRLEEEQHAHIKNTYWPAEEQMLAEFTAPRAWEPQAVIAKRYAGKMWAPLAGQFAKEIRKLECEKQRYCTNAFTKRMQEMQVQRAAARTNITLLADRIAFYEIAAIQETDAERRKQVIALRQGLLEQAATFLAQAAGGFAGAQGNAMGAINSAIQTLGMATTERRQAEAGFGRDPYFHSRAAQGASATLAAQQDADYNTSEMTRLMRRQEDSFERAWAASQTEHLSPPDAVAGAQINAGATNEYGATSYPVDVGTPSEPTVTTPGIAPE